VPAWPEEIHAKTRSGDALPNDEQMTMRRPEMMQGTDQMRRVTDVNALEKRNHTIKRS